MHNFNIVIIVVPHEGDREHSNPVVLNVETLHCQVVLPQGRKILDVRKARGSALL